MTDLLPRIKELLDWCQLGPAAFADEIGVQRPIMSHIISARNKASLEVAQKILVRFPEVDSGWLLLGKGTMLKKVEQQRTPAAGLENASVITSPMDSNGSTLEKEVSNIQNHLLFEGNPSSGRSASNKVIKRVLLLYSDGSFESFDR